jgi:hypothetical protein
VRRTTGGKITIPQPTPYQKGRQTRRLGPIFDRLQQVLQRGDDLLTLRSEPNALAPETLVVFETRGTLSAFTRACDDMGLRILADDEFDFIDDENAVATGHYYLTVPDQRAIKELLRLWTLWASGQDLGLQDKWSEVFSCLHDLRRWGPRDRVTEEDAAVIEEEVRLAPQAIVRLEIELAFDPDDDKAAANRAQVVQEIEQAGGSTRNTSRIAKSPTTRYWWT